MRWLGFISLLVVLTPACGKEVRRSFDGVYCSHQDEDPMYECSRAYDLVCIATDRHVNQLTGELTVDRYVCRQPCQPGQSCPQGGVCCPGKIYGKKFFEQDYACVPYSWCANPPDAGPIRRDTGVGEAGTDVRTDGGAGTDGGSDAADAGVDAPAGSDADVVDAPADADPAEAPAAG